MIRTIITRLFTLSSVAGGAAGSTGLEASAVIEGWHNGQPVCESWSEMGRLGENASRKKPLSRGERLQSAQSGRVSRSLKSRCVPPDGGYAGDEVNQADGAVGAGGDGEANFGGIGDVSLACDEGRVCCCSRAREERKRCEYIEIRTGRKPVH
jgi:hypothetical protein